MNLTGLWTWLLPALLAAALAGCAGDGAPPADDHSVAAVDLGRYAGLWYEIASYPNDFQEGCACTTARYALEGDQVAVVNRCYRDGEWDEAVGRAYAVEGSQGSRLRVSFFWPFYGDYWVIALDPDYGWALVGHPQRRYLWVLSRTPSMSPGLYDEIKERAAALGYDPGRLLRTDQSCPRP